MNRFIENYISNLSNNITIMSNFIYIYVTRLNDDSELYIKIFRDSNTIKIISIQDFGSLVNLYEYNNNTLKLIDGINKEKCDKLGIENKITEYLKNNKDFIDIIMMFKDSIKDITDE